MEYSIVEYDIDTESEKLQKRFEHQERHFDELLKFPAKQSAVLLPVFQFQGVPHVILTERSKNLRVHAGQVALPGGKIDQTDEDAVDAALRETEEEIGLHRQHITIIGKLPLIYSLGAKTVVVPIVGFISDIQNVNLQLNKDEVESVFAVPLEVFINEEYYRPLTVEFNGTPIVTSSFNWDAKLYTDSVRITNNTENAFLKSVFFDHPKVFNIWGLTSWVLIAYSTVLFQRTPAFHQAVKFEKQLDRWPERLLWHLERSHESKL